MIDEGRDQFEEQEFEAERRRDREADHAPAKEAVMLDPDERRRELAATHARQRRELAEKQHRERCELHEPDCPRPDHGGPCHGPLRFELPETPLESRERSIDAVDAVLRRRVPAFEWITDEWLRETAELAFDAGELGF